MDVTTLKRFRQTACNDPVAMQILSLVKPKEASSTLLPGSRKPRYAPRLPTGTKESFATEVPPKGGKTSARPPRPPTGDLSNPSCLTRMVRWTWHSTLNTGREG
jgi:hypothetical protein